jgi:hypothetical protein
MKKKLFLVTLGIIVLLVCSMAGWLTLYRTGEEEEVPLRPDSDWKPSPERDLKGVAEYDLINLGMTLGEVEAAIGAPPGHHDTKRLQMPPSMSPTAHFVREKGFPSRGLPDAAGRPAPGFLQKIKLAMWTWSDYWIWVAFNEDDKAVGCYLLEMDDYFRHKPD